MPRRRTSIVRIVCTTLALSGAVLTGGRGAADGPSVADVRTFGYQIQRGEERALHAVAHDMLIVDVANDFRDWTPDEVASMRDGPCGPRLVLAYLSIGEAEDFRWYAGDLPRDLLGRRVRARRENRYARFWDTRWRDVILGPGSGLSRSSVDRIVDQGFDGVVVDHVDAFQDFLPRAAGGNGERPTGAMDMITLVEDVAHHARVVRDRPGFVVLAQDGTSIVSRRAHSGAADPKAAAAVAEERWLSVIDGVVATNTFFRGRHVNDNPYRQNLYVLERLDRFHAAGEPVFVVDTVTQKRRVQHFHARCAAHGFSGFATNRARSRIVSSRFAPAVSACR